ncbi:MAG: cytidylate kinase [Bacteroidetes bacterium CG_4_10_14_3_um_filter_31_20]|nr:(d)CMP kinase [Bacteroidota bacterium]PIY03866.1 MAG: cytidylate kinase [Bacteroidetes bacterium CG_4_10_14_3_um_filter_31_20]
MRDLIIAIDGYSSCGKSTMAKAIASLLGYTYIDSGAMYRAVTLYCIRYGIIKNSNVNIKLLKQNLNTIDIRFLQNNLTNESETWLNGENVEDEIRKHEVASCVSIVSKIPEVRKKLVSIQRKIGENKKIVMDGRDIGTVVFPEADLKIFMTANQIIRAKRRLLEMNEKGMLTTINEVVENIKQRDYIDENRDVSPLRKADDAIVLDNSNMTREEQLDWVMQKINQIEP